MLKAIEIKLPVATPETTAAFQMLCALMDFPQAERVKESLIISEPHLFPQIVFSASRDIDQAEIEFLTDEGARTLPSSYVYTGDRVGPAISFEEVVRRLRGKVKRVDHVGLIVPSYVSPKDWHTITNILATQASLYDVQKNPEENQTKARMLFMVPSSEAEIAEGKIVSKRRRQPKLEYLYDPKLPTPGFHIDFESTLTREQILALFPDDESFDIPGRGDVFRSINVTAPWVGAKHLRVDLRYLASEELTSASSAECFIKDGSRVVGGGLQTEIGS